MNFRHGGVLAHDSQQLHVRESAYWRAPADSRLVSAASITNSLDCVVFSLPITTNGHQHQPIGFRRLEVENGLYEYAIALVHGLCLSKNYPTVVCSYFVDQQLKDIVEMC